MMLLPLFCFLIVLFETDAAALRGVRRKGTADATFENGSCVVTCGDVSEKTLICASNTILNCKRGKNIVTNSRRGIRQMLQMQINQYENMDMLWIDNQQICHKNPFSFKQ